MKLIKEKEMDNYVNCNTQKRSFPDRELITNRATNYAVLYKPRNEIVSMMKCSSYTSSELKRVLRKSFELVKYKPKKGSIVLIKPNLLAEHNPAQAITTHPLIVLELCKLLKESGVKKIYVGDSAAYNTHGALKFLREYGIGKYAEITNFDKLDKQKIDLGKHYGVVFLPKLLFEVDEIINLAKMKTHVFTLATLCVKNLFGCVPGSTKSLYHKKFFGSKEFSGLLVSLHDAIKPSLNLIDGVIGLEGEGPGATGSSIKSKVIVVSKSAFATDIIASRFMGFKPSRIYTNQLSGLKERDILAVGDFVGQSVHFKKPKLARFINLPGVGLLRKLLPSSYIEFDRERCKQCQLCERKCPVKAIKLEPWPKCYHSKCISCFCCIEVCPHKAVFLDNIFIVKILKKIARKFV